MSERSSSACGASAAISSVSMRSRSRGETPALPDLTLAHSASSRSAAVRSIEASHRADLGRLILPEPEGVGSLPAEEPRGRAQPEHRPDGEDAEIAPGHRGTVLEHLAQPVGEGRDRQQPQHATATASGNLSSGTITPPPTSSSRKTRLAAASVASALSVPAISSPRPEKAAVPSTSSSSTDERVALRGPAEREGDHRQQAICSTSVTSTDEGLRGHQRPARQRRGAEPLEHPVAPLEAGRDGLAGEGGGHHGEREDAGREEVDRLAGARGRRCRPCENSTSSSDGMITVSSSCSPLRSSIRVSSAACAAIMRDSGAAPGRRGDTYRRSCAQLLAGQLEEDVLQGVPLDRDAVRHHAVLRAPGGDGRQQLRVDLAGDAVRARA